MATSLANHVTIVVTADSLSVARQGFGTALILSATAAWAERVRTYERLSDVEDDFDTRTPEYRAASALFSQSPRPTEVKIGRSANKPTLVYTLGVAVVANSTV